MQYLNDQEVEEQIAKCEPIYVRGLGTLKNVPRKAKVARNIHKGEPIIVPRRNEPVFIDNGGSYTIRHLNKQHLISKK